MLLLMLNVFLESSLGYVQTLPDCFFGAIHFRDRRYTASLLYRNRAEITGSHVWTEALSGMAYVPGQKLSLFAFVLFLSHFFKVHALNEI